MLAVLGVLLNAAAGVQHGVRRAGALLAYDVLLADLAVLCSGTGPRATYAANVLPGVHDAVPSPVPYVPVPGDPSACCAACCGPAPALTLPVPAVAGLVPEPVRDARALPGAEPAARHAARPPARGPPGLRA
jgi:hypothetical protein